MFKTQLETLANLAPLLEKVNNPALFTKAEFLRERLAHPASYMVIVGETSSGKSSLVNALLGRSVLPVGAEPTTGSIVEVALEKDHGPGYFAVYKNGRTAEIAEKDFQGASRHPEASLLRLKLQVSPPKEEFSGLRLFDTPGYDSIVENHEDVLLSFLPNADFVLYVINFKIGFQEEDRLFLKTALELVRESAPIAIAINRVPEGVNFNAPRIREITGYLADIFHYTPPVYLVPNIPPARKAVSALPECASMWNEIAAALTSEKRALELKEAFNSYLQELYQEALAILEQRCLAARMSFQEAQESQLAEQEYAKKIQAAIPLFIEPCFDNLIQELPQWIARIRKETQAVLSGTINSADKLQKNETLNFINHHLFSFTLREKTAELQHHIASVLSGLNDKVEDYIQSETIAFNNRIKVIFESNTKIAAQNLAQNVGVRLAMKGLGKYMASFGGRGGANAGIANAASHMLKKVGGYFGKTFSRGTHAALKQTMKKIGLTSVRGIGLALTLLAEGIAFLVDVNIWQSSAVKKTAEALEKWEKDTLPVIREDLVKLRDENIDLVMEIARQVLEDNLAEKPDDMEKAERDMEYGRQLGQRLFKRN